MAIATTTTSALPTATSASTTSSSDTPSTETTSVATSIPAEELNTGDVVGFDTTMIALAGRQMLVAVADSSELRQQGLMFVEDLGDLDGMLFIFDSERLGAFWMKNTLIPLDIAFFADSGEMIGTMTMVPCEVDPCLHYDIGLPYRHALETPSGVLAGVAEGSRLEF